MTEKAFRASGTDGHVTEATPKKAAQKFFEQFPTKRKCDIIEGQADGHFFTVAYGRASEGKWPQSYKDVTKKMIDGLPD